MKYAISIFVAIAVAVSIFAINYTSYQEKAVALKLDEAVEFMEQNGINLYPRVVKEDETDTANTLSTLVDDMNKQDSISEADLANVLILLTLETYSSSMEEVSFEEVVMHFEGLDVPELYSQYLTLRSGEDFLDSEWIPFMKEDLEAGFIANLPDTNTIFLNMETICYQGGFSSQYSYGIGFMLMSQAEHTHESTIAMLNLCWENRFPVTVVLLIFTILIALFKHWDAKENREAAEELEKVYAHIFDKVENSGIVDEDFEFIIESLEEIDATLVEILQILQMIAPEFFENAPKLNAELEELNKEKTDEESSEE